jgi:tetratricopeptide (TPR) repeat protein
MREEVFSSTPAEGVSRYVVLGGSAAMGQNPSGGERQAWLNVRKTWNVEKLPNGVSALPDSLAISGQLESALNQAGHAAEVINAGMIAQDSGAVRDIAFEALEFDPTGLILYLGNNEGIGLSQAMNGVEVPTTWHGVQSFLHQLRIYRVLAGWIIPARQRAAAEETVALQGTQPEVLGRLTLAQWGSAGTPLLEDGTPTDEVYLALLSRFESNLRSIVTAAHAKGVDVYIIPTPPHLAYAPFYNPGPGRPWANDPELSEGEREEQAELREAARTAVASADWTRALSLAEESAAIDAHNADVFHLKGRALHELGRTDEAVEALLRAHSLDVSRKRTQPAFNEIAQRVCEELGCKTTSAHDAILTRARSEGVGVYDRLLGDHEHLNPEGNTWIAGLFLQMILDSN